MNARCWNRVHEAGFTFPCGRPASEVRHNIPMCAECAALSREIEAAMADCAPESDPK